MNPVSPRSILLLLPLLACYFCVKGQCDTTLMPHHHYSLIYVNSETGSQPAVNVIDGDVSSYFRTNGNTAFPHEIQIKLENQRQITQVGILPRQDLPNGKLSDYEVYVSLDSLNWGVPQAKGRLIYEAYEDIDEKLIHFGPIEGRYIRIVASSNEDPSNPHRWLAAEIKLYEDSCNNTVKANQTINFQEIGKQKSTASPIDLVAGSSSGLSVSFELISGPGRFNMANLALQGVGR